MIDRKSLFAFIAITFGISWALFILPQAFKTNQAIFPQVTQAAFALAVWGPGIGAILTTLLVEKQPFKTLRLNTLGPKIYYVWAWLMPPVLTLLTLATTLFLETGQFDTSFAMLRDALASAPAGTQVPPLTQVVILQLLFAVTLAPFVNVIFALGEELGWRGFLLPRLLPLGQWRAILISGAIWGFWHAPTTVLYGYNFPQHPYLGVLFMIIGCMLLGTLLSWLYLNTRSPWVAALAHGAVNASPGLAIYFLKPGFDAAFAGLILGLAGWIPVAMFINWLVRTKKLPVTLATIPE